MTKSVLMVGAAIVIAAPAQAGGLLGGLGTATQARPASSATSGHSSTPANVGIRAKIRAGAASGVGASPRGLGVNGIRASAGTALAGSVRALGSDASAKARGK